MDSKTGPDLSGPDKGFIKVVDVGVEVNSTSHNVNVMLSVSYPVRRYVWRVASVGGEGASGAWAAGCGARCAPPAASCCGTRPPGPATAPALPTVRSGAPPTE